MGNLVEGLKLQAQEARRDYCRQYRARNREKINRQQRQWRADNSEKVREYNRQYWERRAEKEGNIRASWTDYGITPERQNELAEIIRSGQYDDLVRSAAYAANRDMAEYLVISVMKDISYDTLQKQWELGKIIRAPYGRTDFYGARRLFFHYLDCALNEQISPDRTVEGM